MKTWNLLGLALTAATTTFAAVVSPPAAPSVSAGGNSFNPVFSADGQKLVFVSHANNLVTNDDLGLWLDVFVRDLVTSNTVLVSVSTNGTGGANADANYPSLSANGQFIAFASRASNLVPGDTNDAVDVFVRDVVAGTTVLASVDISGNAPADPNLSSVIPLSGNPMISTNGRYVVFESRATTLTADSVTTGDVHLYRRDLWSNITVRANEPVNISPATIQHELGGITPDGAFAAYSRRTNSGSSADVFVHNLGSGTSAPAGGNVPSFISSGPYRGSSPVLSDDGRYVAFFISSPSTNPHAFRHDLQTGTTLMLISSATNVGHGLQISSTGHRVLFDVMDGIHGRPALWDEQVGGIVTPTVCNGEGPRSNPVMNPAAAALAFIGCSNVYLVGLTNTFVSVTTNGSASSADYQFVTPAISPNGTFVAFATTASDLAAGDLNGMSDIYLRDVYAGVTELITKAAPAKPATTAFAHSFLGPNSVSADGRFIVSTRYDDPSAWRDTNGLPDVFVSDKLLGTSRALSVDNNLYPPIEGGSGGGQPFYLDNTNSHSGPIISADGTTVAALRAKANGFNIVSARSSNNVFGTGLFIAHRTGNPGGSLFGNGSSYAPSLSSNGLAMVFTTTSTDFLFTNGTDNNGLSDVVLRRTAESNGVVTGANYLVSVTPGGVSGNNISSNGIISSDGRWVIFESLASNLVPDGLSGNMGLFARDLFSNTTHRVNIASGALASIDLIPVGGSARYSVDARHVTFATTSGRIAMHDLLARTNVVLSDCCANLSSPAPSGDGGMVVYNHRPFGSSTYEVRSYDFRSGQTVALTTSAASQSTGAVFSGDGRYVVFRAKHPTGSSLETNQILVRDRLLGVTLIVSANAGGGAGNAPSTKPVLAANGRTVVFQSFASDLVAGDFNDMRDLFVLTLGGVDSEPDGMDDDWEMAYFETLSRDGSQDWDNDGATDLAEFLAGTDPKNDGSVFRVLTVAPAGGGARTLLWSGNPTRSYRAEFKDDLTATAWTALTGPISWNGTTASISDPTAGSATNRFYRVLRLP